MTRPLPILEPYAQQYLSYLTRFGDALGGDPARLEEVAEEWVRCAESVAATARQVSRRTDPKRLDWRGLTADTFGARSLTTTDRLAAVATELAATAPPLRTLASSLRESHAQLREVVRWFLTEVGRAQRAIARVPLSPNPSDRLRLYRGWVGSIGRAARDQALSVIANHSEQAEEVAAQLRDTVELHLDHWRRPLRLTPYGQHYVAELRQGNVDILATPSDLALSTAYSAMNIPSEWSRRLGELGMRRALGFAVVTTPTGFVRGTTMNALGRPIFEDPLTQATWIIGVNAAAVYGGNEVLGWFNPRAKIDVPGLLTVNNSLSSVLLTARPLTERLGLTPAEFVDDLGRRLPLTNGAYNAELLHRIFAIGIPTSVIFGINAGFGRRGAIATALDAGDDLLAATQRSLALADARRTAGLQFGVATIATTVGAGMTLPPEPGLQRSAFQLAHGAAGWLGERVVQPSWRADPVQLVYGTGRLVSTIVAEGVLGAQHYDPDRGIGLGLSPAGRQTLAQEWHRVRSAAGGIADSGVGLAHALGESFARTAPHWRFAY